MTTSPLEDGVDNAERQRLERLALADWSEAAEAQVHSVIVLGRRAAVNLLINGDCEYSEYFQRDERGQWYEAGSASGHVDRFTLEDRWDEEP